MYIYISHVNVTQTVPDTSPLMPMHQDPLLVWIIDDNYSDVIMTTIASQTPASRLFTQPFIQTQIKENIKAPRHWPLCVEFTGIGEFPAQRANYAENVSIWWRHHVRPPMCIIWPQKVKLVCLYLLLRFSRLYQPNMHATMLVFLPCTIQTKKLH